MRTLFGLTTLAMLIAAGTLAHADPLPAQAAAVADYRISVSLNPQTKQLEGRQRLVWRNPSADTVSDLWFHLYLNAFRNSRSTFMRESHGRLRRDDMPDDGWGWIEVTALTLPDGTDLLKRMTFEAPDDGNREDRTVSRVPLPAPVAPGGELTLEVRFKAQLPRIFARTGYAGDYYLVGQWFPKIAVYEPAGRRGRTTGGWNAHQFHANSEFYADFGHYRVDLTVPSSYIVGATGRRLARRDNGNGTATHEYEQADVHDFAWTASPHFVELKRTFVANRAVSAQEYEQTARLLGRTIDEVKLSDVEVTLLMQPAHLAQSERHLRAAMASIKYFGLWYGRYPHRTLTIVDPGPGGGGSGGMEYPTFITAGTSALFNYWPFQQIRAPEGVTVHEFGHQYWQGLVASNEFEEAWLDEGMNSYSTGRVLEQEYGRKATVISFLGHDVNEQDVIRAQNLPDLSYDAIRQPAWTYATSDSYAFNSYIRPELTLRTLEAYLGPDVMARAMRTYHERWRFRHPSSDDFFAVLSEVSGRDLRPLLASLFERPDRMDYAVASVASERAQPDAGFLGPVDTGVSGAASAGASSTGTDSASTGAAARVNGSTSAAGGGSPLYDTRVIIRRRGDVVLPVTIAFKFAGRPPERQTWDGAARQRLFTFLRPERLEWVNIDPDRRYELDWSWLNNARRIQPDRRATVRLTSRVLFWVQQLAASVGF